jgi:hypothetical protein
MGRPKSWSGRPENQGKHYETEYRRVYRHLDRYFERVFFANDEVLDLGEIARRLKKETSHQIGLKTLVRYLERCRDKCGEAPLDEVYRLNPRYFEKRKAK